jgi:glycosyltransferase involved in cell wall biosynthesis
LKILVIHQYYLRPGDGGGGRFNELARWWRRAGHSVQIVAGQVHYASGVRGARGWVERVEEDGVAVSRVWTPDTWRAGFVGRGAAMGGWAAVATLETWRLASEADVIIASSPSLMAALPGMAAGLRGKPWIFEVRDLWPESAVAMGVVAEGGVMARGLYALEAASYQRATKICAVTPAIRDDILARGLAAPERVVVIPNGAELELFSPGPPDAALRAELGWGERFVALYLGAHGLANGLDQLVDAAHALRDRPDILLVGMGDGPERARLMTLTEQRGLEAQLMWLGSVAREEVGRYLRSAGCGLVVLRGSPTFRTVYPNKLFDAMACGVPVVCNVEGAAAALVADAGAGLCVAPERPDALADAIRWLADHRDEGAQMGHDGRAYVASNFAREQLAAAYLEVLERACAQGGER